MNHLTQNQIDKLTYCYLRKKILSDELVKAKMHMVQCQSCYEEFCIGIVAAYELCEKNLLDLDMLIGESGHDNIFVKINDIAWKVADICKPSFGKYGGKVMEFYAGTTTCSS